LPVYVYNYNMRIGLISDIHSNWEALMAVHEALKSDRVDSICCAGDVVGYCADPLACIEWVQSYCTTGSGLMCVQGNHDYAVAAGDTLNFNPVAVSAAKWTSGMLRKEHIKWLSDLPYTLTSNDIFISHGSPTDPEEFHYILSAEDAVEATQHFQTTLAVLGHSHAPFIFEKCNTHAGFIIENKYVINPKCKYIFNIGSVGQPRDGDPRAAYAVYDTETGLFSIKRVDYDIQRAVNKINEAGLPQVLGSRLISGY
jgi:predicted phosphodiesterase